VEILLRHREPSGDASVRPAVARVCLVAVSVDDQPYRRRNHPRLHAFRGHPIVRLPQSRSNTLLRFLLPDTSFHPRPNRYQVLEAQRCCSRSLAAVSDCILPFRQRPQTNCQSSSFWSSRRCFGEVQLHHNFRRGSRAHTARCYRGVTHPDLRGHSDRLGGLQGRCPLHLLGARVHHGF